MLRWLRGWLPGALGAGDAPVALLVAGGVVHAMLSGRDGDDGHVLGVDGVDGAAEVARALQASAGFLLPVVRQCHGRMSVVAEVDGLCCAVRGCGTQSTGSRGAMPARTFLPR